MKRAYLCLSAVLIGVLAACSGDGFGSASLRQGIIPQAATKSSKTYASIVISIPKSSTRRGRAGRNPRFVSPATQSIAISVTTASGVVKHFNFGLTPSANTDCAASEHGVGCKLTLPLTTGSYTASFKTYDGPLKRERPTGNELSANQTIVFTVRAAQPNLVKVVLGGIPVSVAFIPAPSSTLVGNQSSGYTIPRCNPSPQHVSIIGVDADGNFIVGAGAPSISVRAGGPNLAVTTPKTGAPNLFILTPPSPPSYPENGSAVYLELSAIPAPESGGAPVTTIVKTAFTSEICGIFTEFAVPTASSKPWGIVAGSDGALWFTEKSANQIARIPITATVSNPSITEFPLPTASAAPWAIAFDSVGFMWFTEEAKGQIGRMATTGPPIQEFPLHHPSQPMSIVAGPDGAMWFGDWCANAIGRITTSGVLAIQDFPVPTANSGPSGIAFGSDGAMWFTETLGNKVGRIPLGGAPIVESAIGTARSQPISIAEGPNNALWFTETCSGNACNGKFGQVAAIASAPVQETAPPVPSTSMWGVAAGPDGAMWFTQVYNDILYRVTADGNATPFFLPNKGSGPMFVTTGPDGNIWFTEQFSNKIGRLQ